jgi:hypothetical protein
MMRNKLLKNLGLVLLLVCSLSYISSLIPKPDDSIVAVSFNNFQPGGNDLRTLANTRKFQTDITKIDGSYSAVTGKNADGLFVIETANVAHSNKPTAIETKTTIISSNTVSGDSFVTPGQYPDSVKTNSSFIPITNQAGQTHYVTANSQKSYPLSSEIGWIKPSEYYGSTDLKKTLNILTKGPMLAEGNGLLIGDIIYPVYLKDSAGKITIPVAGHPDPNPEGRGQYGFNLGYQSVQNSAGHPIAIKAAGNKIPATFEDHKAVLISGAPTVAAFSYQSLTVDTLKSLLIYDKNISLNIHAKILDGIIQFGPGRDNSTEEGARGLVRQYLETEKWDRKAMTAWLNKYGYCSADLKSVVCAGSNITSWNDEALRSLLISLRMFGLHPTEYWTDATGFTLDQIRRILATNPMTDPKLIKQLETAKISAFPYKP